MCGRSNSLQWRGGLTNIKGKNALFLTRGAAVELDPNVSVFMGEGVRMCVGVLVLRRFREAERGRGFKARVV